MCNRGATVAEVTRSLAITEATWYRWKNTYRGMKAADARRLKTIVADRTLGNTMLKESSLGESLTPLLAPPHGRAAGAPSRSIRDEDMQTDRPAPLGW